LPRRSRGAEQAVCHGCSRWQVRVLGPDRLLTNSPGLKSGDTETRRVATAACGRGAILARCTMRRSRPAAACRWSRRIRLLPRWAAACSTGRWPRTGRAAAACDRLPHQQARPAQLSDQPELIRSSPDGKCWRKCHWPGRPLSPFAERECGDGRRWEEQEAAGNLYPHNLQEFGYVVESADLARVALAQYWNPMWMFTSRLALGVDR